jgi:hypothetical protein
MEHTRELLNFKSSVCRATKGAELQITSATRNKKTHHYNIMSFLNAFNKYLNFKDQYNTKKKVFLYIIKGQTFQFR